MNQNFMQMFARENERMENYFETIEHELSDELRDEIESIVYWSSNMEERFLPFIEKHQDNEAALVYLHLRWNQVQYEIYNLPCYNKK